MTTHRVAPLAELISQGLVFPLQGEVLQILKPLMHQIQGVVDQLGSLFGGHGS
jgi:hypothetical protein